MTMDKIRIFGFAGSLRKDSYNRSILRAAAELLPENTELEIFDLEGIPPFNQDLEPQTPERVKEFKAGIKAADALLIATPEYNFSMPGVLKNAIDWASRPHGDNSFDGKPLGIMGASNGQIATARAQYHLRQSCVFLNMHPINKPEVMVGFAQDKVDSSGMLKDEKTREIIRTMLVNLVDWTKRLNQKYLLP
jgi:chromate reductase, NAD(P)H dehydrogenase (quinone)